MKSTSTDEPFRAEETKKIIQSIVAALRMNDTEDETALSSLRAISMDQPFLFSESILSVLNENNSLDRLLEKFLEIVGDAVHKKVAEIGQMGDDFIFLFICNYASPTARSQKYSNICSFHSNCAQILSSAHISVIMRLFNELPNDTISLLILSSIDISHYENLSYRFVSRFINAPEKDNSSTICKAAVSNSIISIKLQNTSSEGVLPPDFMNSIINCINTLISWLYDENQGPLFKLEIKALCDGISMIHEPDLSKLWNKHSASILNVCERCNASEKIRLDTFFNAYILSLMSDKKIAIQAWRSIVPHALSFLPSVKISPRKQQILEQQASDFISIGLSISPKQATDLLISLTPSPQSVFCLSKAITMCSDPTSIAQLRALLDRVFDLMREMNNSDIILSLLYAIGIFSSSIPHSSKTLRRILRFIVTCNRLVINDIDLGTFETQQKGALSHIIHETTLPPQKIYKAILRTLAEPISFRFRELLCDAAAELLPVEIAKEDEFFFAIIANLLLGLQLCKSTMHSPKHILLIIMNVLREYFPQSALAKCEQIIHTENIEIQATDFLSCLCNQASDQLFAETLVNDYLSLFSSPDISYTDISVGLRILASILPFIREKSIQKIMSSLQKSKVASSIFLRPSFIHLFSAVCDASPAVAIESTKHIMKKDASTSLFIQFIDSISRRIHISSTYDFFIKEVFPSFIQVLPNIEISSSSLKDVSSFIFNFSANSIPYFKSHKSIPKIAEHALILNWLIDKANQIATITDSTRLVFNVPLFDGICKAISSWILVPSDFDTHQIKRIFDLISSDFVYQYFILKKDDETISQIIVSLNLNFQEWSYFVMLMEMWMPSLLYESESKLLKYLSLISLLLNNWDLDYSFIIQNPNSRIDSIICGWIGTIIPLIYHSVSEIKRLASDALMGIKDVLAPSIIEGEEFNFEKFISSINWNLAVSAMCDVLDNCQRYATDPHRILSGSCVLDFVTKFAPKIAESGNQFVSVFFCTWPIISSWRAETKKKFYKAALIILKSNFLTTMNAFIVAPYHQSMNDLIEHMTKSRKMGTKIYHYLLDQFDPLNSLQIRLYCIRYLSGLMKTDRFKEWMQGNKEFLGSSILSLMWDIMHISEPFQNPILMNIVSLLEQYCDNFSIVAGWSIIKWTSGVDCSTVYIYVAQLLSNIPIELSVELLLSQLIFDSSATPNNNKLKTQYLSVCVSHFLRKWNPVNQSKNKIIATEFCRFVSRVIEMDSDSSDVSRSLTRVLTSVHNIGSDVNIDVGVRLFVQMMKTTKNLISSELLVTLNELSDNISEVQIEECQEQLKSLFFSSLLSDNAAILAQTLYLLSKIGSKSTIIGSFSFSNNEILMRLLIGQEKEIGKELKPIRMMLLSCLRAYKSECTLPSPKDSNDNFLSMLFTYITASVREFKPIEFVEYCLKFAMKNGESVQSSVRQIVTLFIQSVKTLGPESEVAGSVRNILVGKLQTGAKWEKDISLQTLPNLL